MASIIGSSLGVVPLAVYFMYTASLLIGGQLCESPDAPILEVTDAMLSVFCGVWWLLLVIPRRVVFHQPDLYWESTFPICLFVFHATRFFMAQRRKNRPITDAEKAITGSVLTFLVFVQLTQTESFLHHIALFWGIADFFRSLDVCLYLIGYDSSKLQIHIPNVYNICFFLPAAISIYTTQELASWCVAYVAITAAIVDPLIRIGMNESSVQHKEPVDISVIFAPILDQIPRLTLQDHRPQLGNVVPDTHAEEVYEEARYEDDEGGGGEEEEEGEAILLPPPPPRTPDRVEEEPPVDVKVKVTPSVKGNTPGKQGSGKRSKKKRTDADPVMLVD